MYPHKLEKSPKSRKVGANKKSKFKENWRPYDLIVQQDVMIP